MYLDPRSPPAISRGYEQRPGPDPAARRPCRAPLWFDRIGLARANRFRSVKLLCLAFRSGSSGSGPTLATRSGRGSPAPYRRSGGPTLAGPRGGGKPGPTVPLSTGRPPRRGLETRKRLLVLRAVRSPGGGSPAIPTGPGQARRPRHGGSSERPGQRLAAAYQPDRIPLPPKRNTVRRSGQLVDPSSMQLPAVGGHGTKRMDEAPGTIRSAILAPARSWDDTLPALTPLLLNSSGTTWSPAPSSASPTNR